MNSTTSEQAVGGVDCRESWTYNASGVEICSLSHYPRTIVRGFPRLQASGLLRRLCSEEPVFEHEDEDAGQIARERYEANAFEIPTEIDFLNSHGYHTRG